jgi:propanol-preferring alcohol dehydrogenase
MRAMLLREQGRPLVSASLPRPAPRAGQVLIEVRACGVCRTDLHVLDGDLPDPRLPLVLGHEIVGRVVEVAPDVLHPALGERVGVPWLGHVCGVCSYCRGGAENLCAAARFTGYHLDGGYAEYAVAEAGMCLSIPAAFDDCHAAPLLCAGLIGFRAYRMAQPGSGSSGGPQRLGLYGFGAAAHILAQVAVHQGRQVFAFTRVGDDAGQSFARELGCVWAADSGTAPPEELDAAILFAPVGELVPLALRAVRRGGTVVCAGIHMSAIPTFPYADLWGERSLRSVANLTRRDGVDFFAAVAQLPLRTHIERFPLDAAGDALERLRQGSLRGAAVLEP